METGWSQGKLRLRVGEPPRWMFSDFQLKPRGTPREKPLMGISDVDVEAAPEQNGCAKCVFRIGIRFCRRHVSEYMVEVVSILE